MRTNLEESAIEAGVVVHAMLHQWSPRKGLRVGTPLRARRKGRGNQVYLEAMESRMFLSTTSFAVLGDFGTDNTNELAVANLIDSWGIDYIVTVGDNDYYTGSNTIDNNIGKYYHEYIAPYTGSWGAGSPGGINRMFLTPGNHDWDRNNLADYLAYFTLPGADAVTPSPNPNTNERYYTFIKGPVQFFMMDSDPREPDGTSPTSVQGQWLKTQMMKSTAKYNIVMFHHPPYSSGNSHGSNTWMQWPFKEWGADLVLTGHDHVYERIENPSDGLTYIVEGTGGRSLNGFISTPVAGSVSRVAEYGAMKAVVDDVSGVFKQYNTAGTERDSFTITPTTVAPNAPTTLSASAGGSTSINLSWTDNASNERRFRIERSTDGVNFNEIAVVGVSVATYVDTGLTANTTYHYRVRAYNPVGDSAYTNVASTTTLAPGVPNAPTALSATSASTTQIDLLWADNSGDETGFKIERSLDGSTGWTEVGFTVANVRSFSDTGLSASTTYHYRVLAYSGAGNSGYSINASATTKVAGGPGVAQTLVSAGTSWRYLDNGTNQGTAWSAQGFADSSWAAGLAELGYGDSTDGRPEATVVSFGPNSSAKYITTYFRKTFEVVNPAAVSGLLLNLLRDDGAVVYLNGVEVTRSNMPTGTIGYMTLASSSASDDGATWQAFALSSALLVAGTNTLAVEVHQNGATSTDLSFNLELLGYGAVPNAPTGLSAVAVSSTQINLSWTDASGDETGFSLERSANGTTGWAVIATPAAGVTTYSNTGLTASTPYHYRVRANNPAGNSGYSNTATATTQGLQLPAAPSGLAAVAFSSGQINLTWVDNATTESGFKVERSLNGSTGWAQIATPAANATSYSDTTAAAGTTYFYRVRANNATGDSGYSATASATTNTAVTLVAEGSVWKYRDQGVDLGTAWRAAGYDDSLWSSGAAELGFGDGDETTVVNGGPTGGRYPTTYYRRTFTATEVGSFRTTYTVRVRRDDGIVVYLNNAEILRDNMPTGTVLYSTLATAAASDNGTTWFTFNIVSTGLVEGSNTLAVEIHQNSATSSDSSFNLEMLANVAAPTAGPSGLTATASPSVVQVNLAWTDASTNEAGFRIDRATNDLFTTGLATFTVGAGVTAYVDNDVSAGTTYLYRVRAFNAAGNSANTATASATTIVPNAAPTVATAAQPLTSPVTTASVGMSVRGADDGGEAALTYGWSIVSKPVGAADPIFSVNNSYAARDTVATFTQAGSYTLRATITDGLGASVTSDATFNVVATATTVTVSPTGVTVAAGQTQLFSASATDQFGNAFGGTVGWSATGGSISAGGLFTAGGAGGTFSVTATIGTTQGNRAVNVFPTTYTGTSGHDVYALRLSPDGLNLQVWLGPISGSPVFSVDKTAITTLNFNTGDGDDTLTLDGTYGAPLGDYGISFDGGAGTNTVNFNGGIYYLTNEFFNVSGNLDVIIAVNTTVNIGEPPPQAVFAPVFLNSAATPALYAFLRPNAAPTVAQPASAQPLPITGTTATLSVLGDDDCGEADLTYTWSLLAKPAGAADPTFSRNGSHDSKDTLVTFNRAGQYQFLVTIADAAGLLVTSTATVTVAQTLASLSVAPLTNPLVKAGNSLQFSTAAKDQFGQALINAPVSWSTTGTTNMITPSGLFTPGNTSGTFIVTAASGALSASASVTVNASIFTADSDIGVVKPAGSLAPVSQGVYTIQASGNDIWNRADAFHFAYLALTGDGEITARVTGITRTDAWAKAGVMIRESLAAGSRNASALLTPSNGVAFQRRTSTDASTTNTNVTGPSSPYWVKLVRTGSAFTAFRSADGSTWTKVGATTTIAMGQTAYFGLAVTSHNTKALTTATFDNVSVKPLTNLTKGKPATATSTAANSSSAFAVDGNTSTAWNSLSKGTQFLSVDLGQASSISSIVLQWASNYATKFTIESSADNSTWVTLQSQTSGKGGTLDLSGLQLKARYVRIRMTAGNFASYGVSELTVLGL